MTRKRKGGRGGGNGMMGSAIGVILVILAVMSFVKVPGNDTSDGIAENLKAWSDKISEFFQRETQNLPTDWPDGNSPGTGGNGGGGTTPTTPPVDPAAPPTAAPPTFQGITIADSDKVSYNRDEWVHWISAGSGCWDVREEVLYNQADGPVVLLDKNKKETTDKSKACGIKSGTWIDAYTGQTFTDPSKIDIDHMIPLKYTANHGGQAWDADRKREYANSMSGNHLIAVSASANRSKSDKGPGDWKPREEYHCQYAHDWISVATTWGLTITQKDADALAEMLAKC